MNSNTQPGFLRRFWRAFIRLLAVVAVLLILGGVAVAGYLGFVELQRSFNTVFAQLALNDHAINRLRGEMDTLLAADVATDLNALQTELRALEANAAATQEALTAELATKTDTLAALSATIAAADAERSDLSGAIGQQGEGLAALQGDLNENGRRIDDLGGEIDALRGDVDEVAGALAAFVDAQAEVDLVETVALFRVWELITRARFRLLEGNAGLAETDVAAALTTLARLQAAAPETTDEQLETVQMRLELALANLPDAPETAVTDLEAAWAELDAVLADRILAPLPALETPAAAAEPDAAADEAAGTAQPTGTPQTTGTPQPTGTSQPTGTPQPTATP